MIVFSDEYNRSSDYRYNNNERHIRLSQFVEKTTTRGIGMGRPIERKQVHLALQAQPFQNEHDINKYCPTKDMATKTAINVIDTTQIYI